MKAVKKVFTVVAVMTVDDSDSGLNRLKEAAAAAVTTLNNYSNNNISSSSNIKNSAISRKYF